MAGGRADDSAGEVEEGGGEMRALDYQLYMSKDGKW